MHHLEHTSLQQTHLLLQTMLPALFLDKNSLMMDEAQRIPSLEDIAKATQRAIFNDSSYDPLPIKNPEHECSGLKKRHSKP